MILVRNIMWCIVVTDTHMIITCSKLVTVTIAGTNVFILRSLLVDRGCTTKQTSMFPGVRIQTQTNIMFSVFAGSIARSANCRYLIYSEADFEVFRPAGATRTDGGEIMAWRRPPPCQIPPPSVQRQWCGTPKTKIFTHIWSKCGI